jgi:hypothetical protein
MVFQQPADGCNFRFATDERGRARRQVVPPGALGPERGKLGGQRRHHDLGQGFGPLQTLQVVNSEAPVPETTVSNEQAGCLGHQG